MAIAKRFDVEFERSGKVFDPAQVQQVVDEAGSFTDLIVIAHGWNNDMADARQLYDGFFKNMDRVLKAALVPLAGRKIAAVQVFWPSKRFTDADLIPGGGAVSAAAATAASDDSLDRLLEDLKDDPVRLGIAHTTPVRTTIVDGAKALIPSLRTSKDARKEFVFQLRSLMNPGEANADDGSDAFFTADPEKLFQELGGAVNFVSVAGGGGATGVGNAGGAAGIRDMVDGVLAGARRLLNFTTYYQMKERAGTVGRLGVSELLRQVRARHPALKLHLVGHSFGGRVVTAAADALPDETPNVSIALLQAAYSHNGLAEKFDGAHDGHFRRVLSKVRASGPIIITHTKNDKAVGLAYPLASRIADDVASAFGDENDPYGGMGRNGAQHTKEAKGNAGKLLDHDQSYAFARGKVYNLKADEFIKDHSDITGTQVCSAVAFAIAAVDG